MSIKLISKYKKELMAIAMIWLAIYHSMFPINFKPISFFLVTCGYSGVDLFVFLSSFGLYYAYKKNSNYLHFIKRRLLRILPYSIPIYIVLMFLYKRSVLDTIFDSLGLSIFFRIDLTNWFTSFILVAYVLTPLYLKLFNKKPSCVCSISVFLIFVLCLIINNPTFTYVYFRFAIFILGFYFAYLNEKKEDNQKLCWCLVFVMIIGWILMYYMYHQFGNNIEHVYPLLLITPGLLLLLAWIIDKFNYINKPLSFVGGYTFQFYLIHVEVLKYLYNYYEILYRPNIGFDTLINLVGIVLAFIISVIYKKLIDSIVNGIIIKKR